MVITISVGSRANEAYRLISAPKVVNNVRVFRESGRTFRRSRAHFPGIFQLRPEGTHRDAEKREDLPL
jgi:hypothetical protein